MFSDFMNLAWWQEAIVAMWALALLSIMFSVVVMACTKEPNPVNEAEERLRANQLTADKINDKLRRAKS